MRILSKSSLLCLAALIGCSTTPEKSKDVATYNHGTTRSLASVNELVNSRSALSATIDNLMDGIFQSYLIGRVYMHEYDEALAKSDSSPMQSDVYAKLLSIRMMVEEFEHEVNDLYVNLVMVTSLPEYTAEQKFNAELGLKAMGRYMDGLRTDKTQIPENLKPMVLANLREKQTELFEELKEFHDEQSSDNVKQSVHKHMVLLRATRMAFHKQLKNYKVDRKLLSETLAAEKKKKSFKELEAEINENSKTVKEYLSAVGRDVSSESRWVNLSGNTFPANTWSFTFDDGPHPTRTLNVLENLKSKNVPATFFMLAQLVEKYPTVANKLKNGGMDIASHSYSHANLPKVGPVQLEKEIGTAKKIIEDKTGVKVRLFRLPYGSGTKVAAIQKKIMDNGMKHIFWNVDTLDWQAQSPADIVKRSLDSIKKDNLKQGIILFHDIHERSVTASALLMDELKKRNANLCTVQGVIDQMEQNLASCK